ncbi:PAS domain S-box-containing protein [Carboxydocella sporoproducens DSM 16521]|uniref:PAS domain S-box-containing protein n=2 Tax=Carboxydocella TaxID=178898 RepID=A0A1T4N6U2_9FIRM|nr:MULTISPECIES: sigma 54-interacting transcriptional regulator [Carboxydocella]AVX20926.1 PAS domain S-box-containing protein [Carboxydocella thermautotrophica]SJZ74893.1 PAS domain S-box-containing protein [Carboxydocella sporoproducens DSM 16521]
MVHLLSDHLYQAWLEFQRQGRAGINQEHLRPEIAESWRRSRQAGIKSELKKVPLVLGKEELFSRRREREELINLATPYLKSLYSFVQGSGFIVSLVDEEGYLLESVGDPETLRLARECRLVPGACLAEGVSGTNATGLALRLLRPIQVFAAEHYLEGLHPWTCSAAPIMGLAGQPLGAISMTGSFEKVHSHTLGMVVAATQAIEGQLKINRALERMTVLNRYQSAIMEAISEGLLALDEQGRVTRLNQAAARILRLNSEGAIGQKIDEILGEGNPVSRALTRAEEISEEEWQQESWRGQIHCTVSCRPIYNSQQRLVGMVVVVREIQKVRQLVSKMVGARARFSFNDLIGTNPAFLRTVELARQAARSNSTVLLLGESGTGKEVFAQAIHNAGPRASGPFIAINCAALPRELIGSELFGYAEGAFTGAKRGGNSGKFELADGGTVFLDEIGEMPLEMQAHLLRVLQERTVMRIGGQQVIPVDVRVIAATNKNLREEVEKGRFRLDLYYRLNVLTIQMVPLRQRPDDIMPLARFFLQQLTERLGKQIRGFHPRAEELLVRYSWPGNVRELENVIERAVNVAQGPWLTPAELGPEFLMEGKSLRLEPVNSKTMRRSLDEETILNTIKRCQGNLARAARELGVARSTLYRRLEQLGLLRDR